MKHDVDDRDDEDNLNGHIHVDDFTEGLHRLRKDAPKLSPDERAAENYAAWFLFLKRLPASFGARFRDQISEYKLFCTYKGSRHRVTFASRFGDITLTKDFELEFSGEIRGVYVDECTDWSDSP